MSEVFHKQQPPNNTEAEMALLGAILVDRELLPMALGIVQPADFYAHVHETIFGAMKALFDRSEPVDKFTLAAELKKRDALERVGGFAYLTMLMDTVQTASTAEYLAKIIREKAMLRGLIHAGTKIAQLGYDGEDDAEHTMTEADRLLRGVTERGVRVQGGSSAAEAIKRVWASMQTGSKDSQLTPWPHLDKICGGFLPGEMVGWPALPKVGKTGVVLDLADFTAMNYGMTLFFTLEMAVDALMRRYLALYSGISARRQRIGDLQGSDWERLGDAMTVINERPIQFFWRPQSLASMRAIIGRVSRENPVKTIIVDHVGFLDDAQPRRGETVAQAMERCYVGLLNLAAEFGCVVHIVVHLNNEAAKRGEPGLEFIRNGGNLWGAANAIIFPHRPDSSSEDRAQQRVGKFIVAANREGEAGSVDMEYTGHRHLWLEVGQDRPWFEKQYRSVA